MGKVWLDNRICSRIMAVLCVVLITAAQCLMLWPVQMDAAYAATAGETLSVRVQYFGERGDMIREKARFTRAELEAMGAQECYYSNVTSVGTVMSMAAYGPEVLTIIEAAGIDPASISNITFRTTDGYTRNFTVEQHLSGGRFFYPLLSSNYERNEEGTALTPLPGALEGGYEVPAILALTFGATKAPDVDASTLSQGTNQTYRFCMGQTPLTEGVQTRPGQDGGDVSSMDSVHSIYGIDVTLIGSPVEGIGIDPEKTNLKVGSTTKLTILIQGDELFREDFDKALGKLKWTSSDPAIAKVDQKGHVTILKKGTVTITVTAANGMSASVVLNGTSKAKKQNKTARATEKSRASAQTRSSIIARTGQNTVPSQQAQPRKTVRMREISLGGQVKEDPPEASAEVRAVTEDTAVLEQQKPYNGGTAAGAAITALAACSVGGVHRFRRYRSIFKGWKR